MPKVRHFAAMEDSYTEDLKHTHVKRKAVKEESTEELPSKVPRNKLRKRMMELQGYVKEYPTLRTYFDKLQLFLYPYICEPLQRGISQQLWLNDNDEVLDKLLHAFLKDKPSKMSDIVEKICTVTRLQMVKLEDVW
ncbi:hypothetical protein O3P69_007005 [Scylla paramamosain]|uniref:Uncharacterized protein n=1 Tax=Scylla paramamosain TaxID=85552 RepID=A0AAW0V0X0_SCYPA